MTIDERVPIDVLSTYPLYTFPFIRSSICTSVYVSNERNKKEEEEEGKERKRKGQRTRKLSTSRLKKKKTIKKNPRLR